MKKHCMAPTISRDSHQNIATTFHYRHFLKWPMAFQQGWYRNVFAGLLEWIWRSLVFSFYQEFSKFFNGFHGRWKCNYTKIYIVELENFIPVYIKGQIFWSMYFVIWILYGHIIDTVLLISRKPNWAVGFWSDEGLGKGEGIHKVAESWCRGKHERLVGSYWYILTMQDWWVHTDTS